MAEIRCDYCGEWAQLRTGGQVWPERPELAEKLFWCCDDCDARVGCHPHTEQPLGRLADAELRAAKMAAHQAFDRLWKRGPGRCMNRTQAYQWLAAQLEMAPEHCHIGMFDVATCERVVHVCSARDFEDMADA